jgi:DNA-binding CsgD family transcriptional regulator
MNAFADALATEPMRDNVADTLHRPASWGGATQQNHWLIVDLLPQAVMLVQEDRGVLSTNPMAGRLIENGSIRVGEGRLTALGQLGPLHLSNLLGQAALGAVLGCGVWFERCLSTGLLHISRSRQNAADAIAGTPGNPMLLVIQVDQPALSQGARIDALTQKCHLSSAERHVLMLLADGMTVDAAARHLNLQLSTVRSHVRNLLGKTQAPTLMQLLRWTGSAASLPH